MFLWVNASKGKIIDIICFLKNLKNTLWSFLTFLVLCIKHCKSINVATVVVLKILSLKNDLKKQPFELFQLHKSRDILNIESCIPRPTFMLTQHELCTITFDADSQTHKHWHCNQALALSGPHKSLPLFQKANMFETQLKLLN